MVTLFTDGLFYRTKVINIPREGEGAIRKFNDYAVLECAALARSKLFNIKVSVSIFNNIDEEKKSV